MMTTDEEYHCGAIGRCDWDGSGAMNSSLTGLFDSSRECSFNVSGEGWNDIWLTCLMCDKRVHIFGYDSKKNIQIVKARPAYKYVNVVNVLPSMEYKEPGKPK